MKLNPSLSHRFLGEKIITQAVVSMSAAIQRKSSKGDEAGVPSLPPPSRKPPASTEPRPIPVRNELVFHCQLAHGSQTRELKDFSSVKELYARIAVAFDLSPEDVRLNLLCMRAHEVTLKGGRRWKRKFQKLQTQSTFKNWSADDHSIPCIVYVEEAVFKMIPSCGGFIVLQFQINWVAKRELVNNTIDSFQVISCRLVVSCWLVIGRGICKL